MKIAVTLAALAAGLMTSAASADAILSQPPTQTGGGFSDGVGQTLADDVTPASSVVLRSVVFWGGYNTGLPSDNFELRFYNDDGGVPLEPPFATRTLTGLVRTATGMTIDGTGSVDEYRYEATLSSDIILTGGTRIWIAIVNPVSGTTWRWENSDLGQGASDIGADGTWSPFVRDRALELCAPPQLPPCDGEILLAQAPDQANATFSDVDPAGPDGVPNSGSDEQENADAVTFSEDVIVEQIRFWGAYAFGETVGNDDDFTLNIYADAGGGVPTEAPLMSIPLGAVPRVPTGNLILSQFVEYEYLATLNLGVALEANESYWISIVNNTVSDMDDNWAWETSAQGDAMNAFRNPGTVTWAPDTRNLAFEFCGKVCFAPSNCPTDLNGDGEVDASDLALLLGGWGVCPPQQRAGSPAFSDATTRPLLPPDAPRPIGLTTNR